MKRILHWTVTTICAVAFLLAPASAHTGRTDGNGGHWNRATGEYHYHHGQPAHQHYDIDGDGVVDCPYDFDDQTGRNSGTSTGSAGSSGGSTGNSEAEREKWYQNGIEDGESRGYSKGYNEGHEEGYAEAEAEVTAKLEDEKKKAVKDAYTLSFIIGVPAVIALTSAFVSNENEKEIRKLKAKLDSEKNRSAFFQANPNGTFPEGIPDGVKLKFRCIPVKGYTSKTYPYGDFTVFLSASGKKFHRRYNCCNATKAEHFFSLGHEYKPCQRCVNDVAYSEALPEWYLHILKEISAEDIPARSKPEGGESQKQEAKAESAKKYGPVAKAEEPKIDSSFIKSIAYRDEQLFVTMQNGTYCYYDVPESVFKEFLAAPSKGKFFHERINGKYPYY